MLPGLVCNRNLAPEASAGHPAADRSPSRSSRPTPPPLADTGALADKLQSLSLTDDKHRTIQAYALSLAEGMGETRWLIYSQKAAAVSKPMIGVLVFWLAALFFSFGLFSPRNATVTTALFISGLSVSGAIFLILEMYSPYGGLVAVSSDQIRRWISSKNSSAEIQYPTRTARKIPTGTEIAPLTMSRNDGREIETLGEIHDPQFREMFPSESAPKRKASEPTAVSSK